MKGYLQGLFLYLILYRSKQLQKQFKPLNNMKTLFYSVCIFVCAIMPQYAKALTLKFENKAAYVAYYYVSYTNNGARVDLEYVTITAGYSYETSIPDGSSQISVRSQYAKFIGVYGELGTKDCGRSGGLYVFKGSIANPYVEWTPDDGVSGVGNAMSFQDINKVYPNGDTELHILARDQSKTSQIQLLIDKGISHTNTRNSRGFTPLHDAVQSDYEGGIDLLLKAGADMTIQSLQGENPFQMAIGLGKVKIAQRFIAQGYSVAGDTKVLETVVRKRNEEMVKFLLANGADVNTTMSISMQNNNIAMIQMLLNSYAPVVTIDLYKKVMDLRQFDLAKRVIESNIDVNQAIDYAISKNIPEIVQFSMEKGGDSQKALQYAISQHKPDMAAQAITNFRANPNAVLEDAIKSNQTDIVTLLLENGADPNNGLGFAIKNNKNNFISLMIDKGAKVSDEQMSTVAATGDLMLIRKLTDAGGDKNAALTGAMGAKKFQAAEALIQAGASPVNIVKIAVESNQRNLLVAALNAGADANEGLPSAITAGMRDFADLLFKKGAKTSDVALVNAVVAKSDLQMLKLMIDNQTSPDIGMPFAVESNNVTVIQMLLTNGADAHPFELISKAVKNNNIQITGMLIKAGADAKPAELISTSARNKNLSLVELLITAGANPQNGITDAVKANDVSITKALIKAGATANTDLLITSVPLNNQELSSVLIEAGADPSGAVEATVTSNANNVLSLIIAKGVDVTDPRFVITAIKKNFPQNVSLLLGAGVKADYIDETANNFLHIAAAAEADLVVSLLAAAGVKVNDINNSKDAPLHIAVVQGRQEVKLVEEFLTAGADPNLLNGAGKTARDLAKGIRIKNRLKKAGGVKN